MYLESRFHRAFLRSFMHVLFRYKKTKYYKPTNTFKTALFHLVISSLLLICGSPILVLYHGCATKHMHELNWIAVLGELE